jgi:hypothetical protein
MGEITRGHGRILALVPPRAIRGSAARGSVEHVRGCEALADPWVQPQCPLPRHRVSYPDRGLGDHQSPRVHAPVPRRRDHLDAQAGLRPRRQRRGREGPHAGPAQGRHEGPQARDLRRQDRSVPRRHRGPVAARRRAPARGARRAVGADRAAAQGAPARAAGDRPRAAGPGHRAAGPGAGGRRRAVGRDRDPAGVRGGDPRRAPARRRDDPDADHPRDAAAAPERHRAGADRHAPGHGAAAGAGGLQRDRRGRARRPSRCRRR